MNRQDLILALIIIVTVATVFIDKESGYHHQLLIGIIASCIGGLIVMPFSCPKQYSTVQ